MGAEIGALTISHLEEISDAGVRAMAKSGTMATILPTTAYILRLRPPPVRRMIGSSIPIALGSDFNPNAHCFSMVSQLFFIFKLMTSVFYCKIKINYKCKLLQT